MGSSPGIRFDISEPVFCGVAFSGMLVLDVVLAEHVLKVLVSLPCEGSGTQRCSKTILNTQVEQGPNPQQDREEKKTQLGIRPGTEMQFCKISARLQSGQACLIHVASVLQERSGVRGLYGLP